MRALAGHDHEQAQRVFRWPMREAFIAYRAMLHDRDLEAYRYSLLMWTLRVPLVKHKEDPPDMPYWMKEQSVGR